MATPVERGPGSVSPDFTAPSVPVASPGPQLSPQQTDFERFRDAVVTAGRGVAAAVSARASINARLKAVKEQSVARVESDLGLAAAGLQRRRLDRANQQRVEILAEAGSKGMEWAERQFRSGMVNAGSIQESQLWEQAWRGAAQQVSRENAEAKQQAFNSAKRTMSTVARTLQQELLANPQLQDELIGDGTNIGARVQDWMLTELGRAVDLDKLGGEDADYLIHQMVDQSFNISDGLIKVNTERVQSANEALATQQVEADVFSTVSGTQDSESLGRQIAVTLRDRLSHLTTDQQRAYVRGVVSTQMQEMANGDHGLDAIGKIGTASGLLNMTIDGEALFSGQERQELATRLLNQAQATVGRLMDAEIARMREAQTQVITLPDGRTIHRPAANPDLALMTPDPFTGLTPMDEAGNRILLDLGLLGAENLSPEGTLIVQAVRERTRVQAQQVGQRAARQYESVANQRTVYDGIPGGDANKAHRESVQRRAMMTPDALAAADLPPPSAEEVSFLRGALIEMASVPESGLDINAIRAWDGGTIEFIPENAEIIRALQTFDAQKWSNGPTQDLYGIPSDLAEEKTALMVSDDPMKVEAFATWAVNLMGGAGGSWENYLSTLDSNDAAAATLIRTQYMYGTGPQRVAPDPQRLVAQVQAIRSAPSVGTWFNQTTGEPSDRGAVNISAYAQVMAQAIKSASPETVRFNNNKKDPLSRGLQSQINDMLLSTSGNGRTLRNLFFAGQAANPDLTPEQVGSMVWGWMESAGWRFRAVGGRQQLVIDPNNYTGEAGEDIGENLQKNLARTFSPHYRRFLADALGIENPSDVPHNLQDLYIKNSATLPEGIDAFGATEFIPRYGFDDTVTTRLMQSRSEFGGFEFRVGLPDGTDLGNIVTTQDAVLVWPDGTFVNVPKGTPLNVINPDIFADASINEVAGWEWSGMDPDAFRTRNAAEGLRRLIPEGFDVGRALGDSPAQAAREAFVSYEPEQPIEPFPANRIPVDLNEVARYALTQPDRAFRPGPSIGPVGSGSTSNSIFNDMVTSADAAVRRAFTIREPERGAGVPWLTGRDRVFFRPSEPGPNFEIIEQIRNMPDAPRGFQASPNREQINRIFEQE